MAGGALQTVVIDALRGPTSDCLWDWRAFGFEAKLYRRFAVVDLRGARSPICLER